MKTAIITAIAATLVAAAPAAAVTVDVNATTNASVNGTNAVNVLLAAGTYKLAFVQGAYTAATRFSSVGGCDGSGKNCQQGYENSVSYTIGATTFGFGDGASQGGIGPISPGDAYYADAASSFANSTGYSATFTLAAPQNVSFYFFDDYLGDNSGGVSLSISAVPEPAMWGMMIAGFGAVGFAARRRRVAVTFA